MAADYLLNLERLKARIDDLRSQSKDFIVKNSRRIGTLQKDYDNMLATYNYLLKYHDKDTKDIYVPLNRMDRGFKVVK